MDNICKYCFVEFSEQELEEHELECIFKDIDEEIVPYEGEMQ
jgi:hypothetical protein